MYVWATAEEAAAVGWKGNDLWRFESRYEGEYGVMRYFIQLPEEDPELDRLLAEEAEIDRRFAAETGPCAAEKRYPQGFIIVESTDDVSAELAALGCESSYRLSFGSDGVAHHIVELAAIEQNLGSIVKIAERLRMIFAPSAPIAVFPLGTKRD